jgi:hypothetical protein
VRALAAVISTLLVLGLVPQAQAATRRCGSVAFNANSSQGAFNIVALRVGCRTARKVARHSGRARSHSYDALGFHCRALGRAHTAIYMERYRCRSHRRTVTFEAQPVN